jgi:hypothetical protein
MLTAIILVFILGYMTIVFEHPLRLDKTVPALLMGALCWALAAIGFNGGELSHLRRSARGRPAPFVGYRYRRCQK